MNNITWGSKKNIDNGERTLYWVQCSDRPPINDSEVMLTTQTDFISKAVFKDNNYYKETINGSEIINNVIAWMYYPSKFKLD